MEKVIHKGGGEEYTFGSSKAAVVLMSDILKRDEFKSIRDNVMSKLSKQDWRLNSVMDIKDNNVRETTLLMWHKQFASLVKNYPTEVKNHVLNVETGMYRKLLRKSKSLGDAK